MEPEFWLERWRTAQIGFHQAETNSALVAHWSSLDLPKGSRVFVPLCGKSLDMVWLAGQGHSVTGVELSQIAIDEFFQELSLTPEQREEGGFTITSAGPYELWCGDFFALPARPLAQMAAIYDRASLIALPSDLRREYAIKLSQLNRSGAPQLLLTIEYDQSAVPGPPFSVVETEVRELYEKAWEITELARGDTEIRNPKFLERGLEVVTGAVYQLRPRQE